MTGMEIRYLLYDPTIEKIEVLRLEKRLDENLLYLKDAPPEHSTFPLDMEPEFIAEDEPVPINPVQVLFLSYRIRPQITRTFFLRFQRSKIRVRVIFETHRNCIPIMHLTVPVKQTTVGASESCGNLFFHFFDPLKIWVAGYLRAYMVRVRII